MKCPYCETEFHPQFIKTDLGYNPETRELREKWNWYKLKKVKKEEKGIRRFFLFSQLCPKCKRPVVFFTKCWEYVQYWNQWNELENKDRYECEGVQLIPAADL
jgi:hypothetical protein